MMNALDELFFGRWFVSPRSATTLARAGPWRCTPGTVTPLCTYLCSPLQGAVYKSNKITGQLTASPKNQITSGLT